MQQLRCKSPICVPGPDGARGRMFTPPENAQGLENSWCANCIKVSNEIQFFSRQTAEMIRHKYQEMRVEDLPANVGNILTAFTRDILAEFGEDL